MDFDYSCHRLLISIFVQLTEVGLNGKPGELALELVVLDRRQEVERVQVLLPITEVQAVLVKTSRLEDAVPTTAQVCLNA